jgi:chromosome segregation protein
MLISEVILKNFMSYEYTRIPLKNGVNVISGPNGSGKSSLLLGICVALGDTYTERSKKLSDLIRWGEDLAEVSLSLDNRKREGDYRPVPRFDMDEIRLTRYLRRDGKYWFELNQRHITKTEVVDILNTFGFDPSNMLIIMHQAMPSRFANLNPKERLQILEEAVGFDTFREDVIEAKKKLSGILSEEESLNQLLDRARETLGYWREQYESLQEKKQHQKRMSFLQRELAWINVIAFENETKNLKKDLEDKKIELFEAEEEIEEFQSRIVKADSRLKNLRGDLYDLIERRADYERILGMSEQGINTSKDQLVYIERLIDNSMAQEHRFEISTQTLKERLKAGPTTLDDYINLVAELEQTQQESYSRLRQELITQRSQYEARISQLGHQLMEAEREIQDTTDDMQELRDSMDNANDEYVESRINLALLRDRRSRLGQRIEGLEREIDRSNQELKDAKAEAMIKGSRIETGRDSEEVLGEIRQTSGKLMGLREVSEEAEEMYDRYQSTYREIQAKVEQVREHRKRIMDEIRHRTQKWKTVIKDLLSEVNIRYQKLLTKLQATGEVRLINPNDIEEAGLEIYVGFKGAQQSKLDPYIHSGGERSISVITFLLAMQQNILSPFRAVDEFDLHMDPQNKEIVSDFIVSTMEGTNDQYMAITPSQVTFKGKDVHIMMVHKTEDVSEVSLVEDE